MDPLLAQQLLELGLDAERAPALAAWRALLTRVDAFYRRAAEDRVRVEQSVASSSEEATRAVLDATLDALADGVLVVDQKTRGVSLFNKRFGEMWGIPHDALSSRDDQRLVDAVLSRLADPGEFVARIEHLYEHPTEVSDDRIRLIDNRTFDRHSAPVLSRDGHVMGRVWFFRDVTAQLAAHDELRAAERKAAVAPLERELAIAQQIQTSLLPTRMRVASGEVAAGMRPASSVGGDYYDLFQTEDGGCWIGIGDVSGHGLNAGLIMLMIQSGIASIVRKEPNADPHDVIALVNQTLYENVRTRLKLDDFVTLSLLRYFEDGRIAVAGAHEEIVVWRAAQQGCEVIPTHGTWLGAMPDVSPHITTTIHRLRPGDILLLYTDGITEAMSTSGEQFGLERLIETLSQMSSTPVQSICEAMFDAAARWSAIQADDQTVLALRYRGDSAPS